MSQALSFDYQKTGLGLRLSVAASAETFDSARQRNRRLTASLGELARRKFIERSHAQDQGLSFGVNSRALGRLRSRQKKYEYFEAVTAVIADLVIAAEPEEVIAEGDLQLEAYFPLASGDFGLHARIGLPNATDIALQDAALYQMQQMARDLRFHKYVSDPTIGIKVEVNSQTGVSLVQSTHSNMHTSGERFMPGDRAVELFSNNVESPHEPLIYLAGMTALAKADVLVSA